MHTAVETSHAPAAIGSYSQAIRAGGLLFCSGQLPMDPATGVLATDPADAAAQALRNLEAVLQAGGASCADVVKTTVFLTNLDDFQAVNEVYARFFPGTAPARACVEVRRLPKGAVLEIEAVAVLPSQG